MKRIAPFWRRSLIVLLVMISLGAATASTQNLAKRSRIELQLGMSVRTNTSVSTTLGGASVETGPEGFMGSIGYSYWVQENLAVTISAGALASTVDVNAGIGGTSTYTASVGQILLGTRYYVPRSTYGTSFRPYLSLAVGPVIGSQSGTSAGTVVITESISETAFGGRLGTGVDIILSRRIMLGVLTGYNLMTDFSRTIGSRANHSGPDFAVSFSILFGRGEK